MRFSKILMQYVLMGISESFWPFLTNFFFFLSGSSELYATSSHDDVRVWHADTGKELLRVTNSNMICHAVCITPDGKAIITGNYSLISRPIPIPRPFNLTLCNTES